MPININNYEEYFLLYIDRELGDDERRLVEDFVRRHPDLEKELEMLKQTLVMPPDLVFENKDSLLRKEKKRNPYPLYRMRIAATALILLAGTGILFITVKIRKNEERFSPAKKTALNQPAFKIKKLSPAPVADQGSVRTGNPKPAAASGTNTNPVSPERAETVVNTNRSTAKANANSKLGSVNTGAATDKTAAADRPAPDHKSGDRPSKPDQADQQKQVAGIQGIPYQETDNETAAAHPGLPQTATDLPGLAQQNEIPSTNPSTIHHPPSTILPSTVNRQPSTISDATSILVFNKPVTAFLRKLRARSSGSDATAGNLRRQVRISVFQFSLNK